MSLDPGHMPESPGADDPSVLGVLLIFLRHARLLITVPPLATAALVGGILVTGRPYRAESVISPQAASGSFSQLSGLAAQFGIGLPAVEPSQSVDYYAAVARSRDLLLQVALTEFQVEKRRFRPDTIRGPLIDILEVSGDTDAERHANAVDYLLKHVSTSSDLAAGILTIRTTAESPELAEAINRRILELLNEFNLSKRQTLAALEKEFIEDRLQQAHRELLDAEEELESFLTKNRSYQNSPHLAFEASRLERIVDLRQQVYATLAQAYEKARIDVVRNTPVFTVIDAPDGSARPSFSLRLVALGAMTVVLAICIGIAFLNEFVRREHALNPARFQELQEAKAALSRRLAGRWRRR